MAWRIGVDIGGTFTDVVLVDEASGRIGLVKLLTTSDDFGRAVIAGLEKRSRTRGARTGYRPWPRSRCWRMPRPSSPTRCSRKRAPAPGSSRPPGFATCSNCAARPRRSLRSVSGSARHADAATLAVRDYRADRGGRERWSRRSPRTRSTEVIAAIRAAGLESVAVALLFSFFNDAHERLFGEHAGRIAGDREYVSCEILPRFASSSGQARLRSAPMSESCSPPISTGCNAPPRSSGCPRFM